MTNPFKTLDHPTGNSSRKARNQKARRFDSAFPFPTPPLNLLFGCYVSVEGARRSKLALTTRDIHVIPNGTMNNLTTVRAPNTVGEEEPEVWETWFYGMLIMTITCISSPLGIVMVPLLNKALYERCMTFLVALGIGAMSGSCLFILLPHSFNITEVTSIDYLQKCWLIVGALYGFFAIDRLLQCLLELRRRRQNKARIHATTIKTLSHDQKNVDNIQFADINGNCKHNGQEQYEKDIENIKDEIDVSMLSNKLARTFSTRRRIAILKSEPLEGIQYQSPNGSMLEVDVHSLASRPTSRQQSRQPSPATTPAQSPAPSRSTKMKASPASDSSSDEIQVAVEVHEKKVIDKKELEVASVAYMIIFGSAANNFVDGMSIGAAFSDSVIRGISIGMAVVSQQFPQELGTLAILINSGLGLKRTLLVQIIPIIMSYLGFGAGVVLDNLDDSYDSFIFSISAGMYLYIFLGTLLPEIRDSFNELLKNDLAEALLTTVLQFTGIIFGTTFMFLMNITNDEI
ncbi:unnamed protein product [Bursaphelenchus okinawaensis]|uniref:Uncharacterized protein n=1 Tax=Bursaphelenchus okinawaensis TaxID=465554 RepID=A0A811LE85_9BILA|nr:unnamed protein product [Bursaphelenchus okinawaensis]CAG9120778.1 unnamed protein product [Bursaphelenchus okinawaensis]